MICSRSPGNDQQKEEDLERLCVYKMDHPGRGVALIFNHENFEDKSLMRRDGAEKDGQNISETLENFGFDVRYYKDLKSNEIEEKLSKVAKEDHSDRDCLLVAIMTYGEGDGSLHAFNSTYKEEKVWGYFVTEKVPSLGGKPKIFLFQACPVQRLESEDVDSIDSPNLRTLIIPSHADFLKIYSSEGSNSLPDSKSDSSFLLCFCKELQEYGSKADFISILTKTLNIVKTTFPLDSKGPKSFRRMPIVTSTLTRRLFLMPKSHIPCSYGER
ncbi:hypothetical protein J437_LFUL018471 [Ladona fulva]|uniref:Caspase-3 n=1 Tax=Ladona fulva TaxID=123851 RepID=A0A8K0PA74_LADFU|nr:hypothetical protein J437_LFUL018471 [Ladona fulva]